MSRYEPYVSRILQSETIDNKLVEYIETTKKRYLYGNGLQTAVCLGIFRDMGVDIAGILLPPGCDMKALKGYWGRLVNQALTYHLQDLNSEEFENAYIMMSIPREEYKYAQQLLNASGAKDVIGCCWKHNSELNDICYEVWRSNN